MTQPQWGNNQSDGDISKLPFLKEIVFAMRDIADKHFGTYGPASLHTIDIAMEIMHDFEICFQKLKGFGMACNNIGIETETLKVMLQYDFIDRYEKRVKEDAKQWQ